MMMNRYDQSEVLARVSRGGGVVVGSPSKSKKLGKSKGPTAR